MTRASVKTQNQAEQKPSADPRHFASDRQLDAGQAQSLWRAATSLSPLATPPRASAPTLMRFPDSGLAVNQPGDIYEQEADRMADEIMRMPSTEPHRKCTQCEEEEEGKLHRKETGAGPATAPAVVHEVLQSPGQPLDAGARAFMEPRFGHDFSRVRVHTDAKAAESAKAVNALAYTAGSNIVFANAQYEPQNLVGRRLLSHELAHVVQQQGAEKVRRKRESWRENGCEASTDAIPTKIFRQVAPSPVARRTAVQIFGNPAAVPPVPGMTLSEFRTYTQLQSDWFVEPSLAAGMKRDFLWSLLLRAEEGPHILAGIGDIRVSALKGIAAADWAPLVKFCQGTHASGHTVRIFSPLPALADRIAIGRTLSALEAIIPAAVLEFTVSHVQLVELWTQGLMPVLTQYWNDYDPRIEQTFVPAPAARGPEMERVLNFLRSLGAPGLVPLALLRGAIPDERWVRNLHRFPLAMLQKLVANLGDLSGVKRLILVLHTGTDAPAAFQGAANLFNDLVLLSPNNLVLMIEGAPTLASITARIPNITSTWGQKVGGVRRISQVLIAGHGSTQTVGLAGTGAPVVNNGAVTYPTENLVAGQAVGAPPTPTTALFDALMSHMPPATARILYVGCLVGAAHVPAGTAAAAIPGIVAAQQNLAAFTDARATAAGVPAGRVQAARASVGVAGITSVFDAAGDLKANFPVDPNAFGSANTYAQSGLEPEGVLRAAVEVGATNKVLAELLLRTRLGMPAVVGNWYDQMTRLMVGLALPPAALVPVGVDLQKVNELANVAEVPFLVYWAQFDWINANAFSTRLNPQPFAAAVYAGVAALTPYTNPPAQHTERLRIVVDQGRLALAGAPLIPTFLAGILATNLSANAIAPFLDLGIIGPHAAALLPLGVAPTVEQIRLALAWFSRDPANANVRNFLTGQVLHPPNAPAAFTPAVSAAIQAAGLTDREVLDDLGFAPIAAAPPPVGGGAPLPIANLALPGSATNTLVVSGHPYLAHVTVPNAKVRKGPAAANPSFVTLPNAAAVRVMGFSGGWAAADINGRLGFMLQGELSPP